MAGEVIEFKTRFADVFRALKTWREQALAGAFEGVQDAMQRFQVTFIQDRLTKTSRPPGGPGGINSARLRRACKSETKKIPGGVHGRVFFRGHYEPIAAIHETGGPIVPRRKKWLTIPTDYAKKKFRIHGDKVLRAPRIPNTFFEWFDRKGGGKALGLFEEPRVKGGDPMMLFLLVKKVQIPARLHFYSDWQGYEPTAWKIIEKARDRVVANAQRMFS